jgi:hypothetical protein
MFERLKGRDDARVRASEWSPGVTSVCAGSRGECLFRRRIERKGVSRLAGSFKQSSWFVETETVTFYCTACRKGEILQSLPLVQDDLVGKYDCRGKPALEKFVDLRTKDRTFLLPFVFASRKRSFCGVANSYCGDCFAKIAPNDMGVIHLRNAPWRIGVTRNDNQ